MPALKPFEIWRGNTFQRNFVFKSGDAPYDLTDCTVTFTLKYGDRTMTKSTADNTLTLDASAGKVGLTLNPAETKALPPSYPKITYELEVKQGEVQTTVLAGSIRAVGGTNGD